MRFAALDPGQRRVNPRGIRARVRQQAVEIRRRPRRQRETRAQPLAATVGLFGAQDVREAAVQVRRAAPRRPVHGQRLLPQEIRRLGPLAGRQRRQPVDRRPVLLVVLRKIGAHPRARHRLDPRRQGRGGLLPLERGRLLRGKRARRFQRAFQVEQDRDQQEPVIVLLPRRELRELAGRGRAVPLGMERPDSRRAGPQIVGLFLQDLRQRAQHLDVHPVAPDGGRQRLALEGLQGRRRVRVERRLRGREEDRQAESEQGRQRRRDRETREPAARERLRHPVAARVVPVADQLIQRLREGRHRRVAARRILRHRPLDDHLQLG